MLFNSIHFLLFFPVVLGAYFLLPPRWRNLWLLLSSYYFYAAWKPEYVFLLIATTCFDYAVAIALSRFPQGLKRKLFLVLSLSVNVGVLIYFKYLFFFSQLSGINTNAIPFSLQNIVLPLGISFYTFQSMSYVVDVYRGRLSPERNFITYALFVVFFPQLVAGPIERAGHLIAQLKTRMNFDFNRINSGLKRMAWGMFKKVVVADRLALLVDPVFENPGNWDGLVLWAAAVGFTFQILADFSGYTDIAIGAARCFGIQLVENFSAPFSAVSFTDFWKRWHISLNTWFRDYVYHPLGGNRKGKLNTVLMLMLTFLLSGLWHGAALTFIAFGAIHGLIMVSEYLFPFLKKPSEKWKLLFQWRTYLLFTCTLVIFRCTSLSQAFQYWGKMFSFSSGMGLNQIHLPALDLILMPMLIVFMEVVDRRVKSNPTALFFKTPIPIRLLSYSLLIIALIFLGVFQSRQFIYFQF